MSHIKTIFQLTDALNNALGYLEDAAQEMSDPLRRGLTLKYADAGHKWAQSVVDDIMKEALPGKTD